MAFASYLGHHDTSAQVNVLICSGLTHIQKPILYSPPFRNLFIVFLTLTGFPSHVFQKNASQHIHPTRSAATRHWLDLFSVLST